MRIALCLPVLAVSCAVPGPFGAEEEPSVYGAFLAARYAGASRDTVESSRLYAEALAFDPHSEFLSERAFYSALLAGDFRRADRAARIAGDHAAGLQLAHVYLKGAAIAGRTTPPEAELTDNFGPFATMIATMLDDWALVRAGRAGEAADRPVTPTAGLTGHLLIHRAMVLEAAGRLDAADEAYRAAYSSLDLEGFTTVLRGGFLERRGRTSEARQLYQRHLDRAGSPDQEVHAALARLDAGGPPPPRLTPAQGAARALFAPAALLNASAPAEYAALYLRLVQGIDPEFHRNTLLVATMLDRLGLEQDAVAAFDAIRTGPLAEQAQVDAAWMMFRMGNRTEALARARTIAAATVSEQPRLLLADIYRLTGNCSEAVSLYDAVMADREAAGTLQDWRHVFYRAVCLQMAGDWPGAEAGFLQALELSPDEARVLNHLGYNWIVLGERVDEGFALVERAAELAPDNGAILDSLGWGHFKLGRYDEAVEWLERAVELSPSNPTIHWHLGDAYARTGRMLEAGFQWQRARDLTADPREEALIEIRLAEGLDAAPAGIE
ncbi:MAG: tetratricopeptide repeat protein [Glycocaulis sp.]